jgi:hypothetical protein
VAELQATRSPDAAIRRAVERVGEEVSGILQRAHEAAAQITFQSRSDAEDRLEAARQEAAQIVTAAEEQVRELDAETDRIWAERHRIVEDTRELAGELLTLTDSAANSFPAETVDAGEQPAADAQELIAEDDVVADEIDADQVGADEVGAGEVGAGEVGAGEAGAEPYDEEDVEPEDIFSDEPDPHVEPTAVLPVVEPRDDDDPAAESH